MKAPQSRDHFPEGGAELRSVALAGRIVDMEIAPEPNIPTQLQRPTGVCSLQERKTPSNYYYYYYYNYC